MEHASLASFLKGGLSPEELGNEVAAEVDDNVQFLKLGGVGYIKLTSGPEMVVTREHARRLLLALAEARLPFASASYTADCLVMSDDFEFADDAVAGAIAFLADDSRDPTPEEIRAALARLA